MRKCLLIKCHNLKKVFIIRRPFPCMTLFIILSHTFPNLTPEGTALFEKLIVAYLIKGFSPFMEYGISLHLLPQKKNSVPFRSVGWAIQKGSVLCSADEDFPHLAAVTCAVVWELHRYGHCARCAYFFCVKTILRSLSFHKNGGAVPPNGGSFLRHRMGELYLVGCQNKGMP
jgi:hypothetical protein